LPEILFAFIRGLSRRRLCEGGSIRGRYSVAHLSFVICSGTCRIIREAPVSRDHCGGCFPIFLVSCRISHLDIRNHKCWWRLRLSALKPVHGGYPQANSGESCRYRFQLNVHPPAIMRNLIGNERSGLSTVLLKSAGAHVVQPSGRSGTLLQARISKHLEIMLWRVCIVFCHWDPEASRALCRESATEWIDADASIVIGTGTTPRSRSRIGFMATPYSIQLVISFLIVEGLQLLESSDRSYPVIDTKRSQEWDSTLA
jgi:hypothetical protein